MGIALTDAQIAELKTDIVWLVITGQGSTIDGKANQIATGATDPTTGKTPSRDATDVDKVGGINLALSIGASSNDSRSEQNTNIEAAGGTPITWHIAEPTVATAIKNLLQSNGYSAIKVANTLPK